MNDELYKHKLKLVNVRIPCEWNNKLDLIAEREEDTKSNILRKLIKDYLKEKGKNNGKI